LACGAAKTASGIGAEIETELGMDAAGAVWPNARISQHAT
jgi:hypothetical protein